MAPAEYAVALHYWTGSKEHYAALIDRARSKGITLSAEGLRGPKGKTLKVETEADIYRRLGLKYVAPELRENQGEIEAAATGTLPEAVVTHDIQGMVHCHTTYSDGQNTVEEMARAAEALGITVDQTREESIDAAAAYVVEHESELPTHFISAMSISSEQHVRVLAAPALGVNAGVHDQTCGAEGH